jgi:transposase
MNAKMVYALLLGRSTVSASENNCDSWTDERGAVFVIYSIENLANHLQRGTSTIKKALLELEQSGLIERKRMGMGKPNRLYVLIPQELAESVNPKTDEMCPPDSRYSGCQESRKADYQDSQNVSTIKKSDNNYRNTTKGVKLRYGRYENVSLSQSEYDSLKGEYPLILDNFIEQLSAYKKSTGKKYADDGATLVAWINRSKSRGNGERNYDCDKGECLI